MTFDFKSIQRQILFSFCQFLTIEYNLPRIIQILNILYTTLHSTSYIFNYSHQSQQFNDSLTKVTLISRLHFYITNQSILNAIFWTITIIQNTIIFAIILIALFLRQYSSFKIINIINSFYIYLISLTFYPFIMEICFLNSQNVVLICISIILLIETLLFMIIGEIIYRRGLTLKPNTNLYINMTIQSYLIKILKIIQIIIYFYLPQKQITQIIEIIINILIQLFLITEILFIKIYGNIFYNNIQIILSSISLIISFDVLLTSSIFNRNYWILISLILIQILIKSQQLPLSLNNLSINHLKYLFNFLELSNPEKSVNKLYIQLLFTNHTQNCEKKNSCVCFQYKNQNYYKALLHVTEMKIENYLHQKNEFSKDLIYLDYAQILLRRHQYVRALQHISKSLLQNNNLYNKNHQPLSIFTIFLLEFLKEQVLNDVMIQISEKIVLNHPNNKLITDSLKQFVINESTDQQIITNLKKIIQQKMLFYYQFIETQNTNCGNIHYAVQFIQQIQEFKENLLKRYEQFPTNTNQNLLKYFELNILNDYIESFQTNKGKAFEEEKYNQFSGQMYHKIFGTNPAYFITELNSDLNIIVTKYSNKAHQLLDQWRTKQPIYELNHYLPEYVINQHPYLIEEFLNDGKNKYYQQQNLAFIKTIDKIMIPIQIMLSINSTNSDRFSFLVFFYEAQDYCSYIVANQNFDIINVSQNIQESLFCCGSRTSHVQIDRLIPNFQTLIHKNQKQYQFFNQELKLIKENMQTTTLQTFTGNIKIDKKFNNQQLCYFIELDNIRPISKKINEEMSTTFYFIPSQREQWNSTQKFLNINSELDSVCEKVIPYVDFEHKIVPENSLFIINNYDQHPVNQTDTKDTNFMQTQQMLEYYKSQNFQEPLSQKRLLHSSKYSHDDDIKKQVNKIVEEDEFNEIGSTSSVTAIRKSKYYKKFEIITILMRSKRQSKKIVTMNKYLSLYLTIIIIGIIIQIVMISNLQSFIKDIQNLSIRYDVIEPYESFYVSRFSQVNYREQLSANVINQSQFAQLAKYPFSTFELMYVHLRDSMYKVLQRSELDLLTDNQLIPIYFLNYSKNYTNYIKNVSIRSLVNILMNYQYDFKLGLTIRSVAFDSPFFYFTSKNYLTIKNTFDGLNSIVLDSTLQRSQLEKQKWLYVLLPFLIITFILSLFIIYQFHEYNIILNQIFLYLLQIDQIVLDNEKQRLQKHLNIINQEIEKVKQFQFDIDEIDKELDESDTFKNKNLQKKSQNNLNIINHDFSKGVAILLVHLLTFLGFYFAIFIIIEDYLLKYDRTAVSFQKISDLGVDIPTMYAQREVIYRRKLRYFYLSDQEVDGIYAVFFKAYSKVEEFSKDSLDISTKGYLFDDSAVNFFQAVKQGNLCDYQTTQFKELSKNTNTCPIAMNGNLEKGLSQILPYILYTLKTQQFDSKNFTILPNNTRLELEGATILGNVMQTVISQLYQNLLDSCQLLIFYTQLPCILVLILQFLIFCLYAFIISPKIRQQFQSIKQSIFLFPRQTLIFDDQFYRNFRSIIKDEGIQQ